MASELRVNQLQNRTGLCTVTYSDTGAIVSGIVTANSFSGGITGGAISGTTGSFSGDVSIADKIVHTGDTHTAIRFAGNDIITAEIAGTETFRIDSSGLKIVDKLIHSGDTNTAIRFPAADTITAETGGSERLRITSDGKIGIGEDDPDGNYLLIRAATTVGTTKGHIMLTGDGATNGEGPQIVFSESGSGSSFAGAYIGHVRTTTNSVGDLVFGTRATGGDANTIPTERLRIDSTGRLLVGTSTAAGNGIHVLYSTVNSAVEFQNNTTGTGSGQGLYVGNSTGNIGYVWNYANDAIAFGVNNAEKFRLESSGKAHFWTGNNDYTNPDIGGSTSGVSLGKNVSGQIYAAVDDTGTEYWKNWVCNFSRRNNAGDGPQIALDRGGWAKASIAGLQGGSTASSAAGQFAIYTHDFSSGSHVQTERFRIGATGKVGIATDNPYAPLSVRTAAETSSSGNFADNGILLHAPGATDEHVIPISASFVTNAHLPRCAMGFISHPTADPIDGYAGEIGFYTHDAADGSAVGPSHERVRITRSGRLSVGNTAPQELLHVFPDAANTTSAYVRITAGDRAASTGFNVGHDVNGNFQLNGLSNGTMYFSTNGSVRMSLRNDHPDLVVGATGGWTDYGTVQAPLMSYGTSGYPANCHAIKGVLANTSFSEDGGGMFFLGGRRSTTSDYTMAGWYTGNGSSSITSDRQFRFIADGNAYCDGSWNGGGADYAEFFEWSDGNSGSEDRRGVSVVLVNGKIRPATGSDSTDNIIGVVSAHPVVVGDSASERWADKWITDDFGSTVYEEYTVTEWYDETKKEKVNYATDRIPSDVTVGVGSSVLTKNENGTNFKRKKLNPSWNSTATYIPRKDRKEWDAVGLVGKLKVKSDQPIGTKWIKMREVNSSVHEYLIR